MNIRTPNLGAIALLLSLLCPFGGYAQTALSPIQIKCSPAFPGVSILLATTTGVSCVAIDPAAFVLDTTGATPILRAIAPVVKIPTFVSGEVPTGAVDGNNLIFTLKNAPVGGVMLHVNGLLNQAALDYTISGYTITFAAKAAPQPGWTLLAAYFY